MHGCRLVRWATLGPGKPKFLQLAVAIFLGLPYIRCRFGTHLSWTLRLRDQLSKRLIVQGKMFGDTLVGDTTSWYRVYLPPAHRVDRVLSFSSCRGNWDSPTPHPHAGVPPPPFRSGGHTRLREKGGGGVPTPTRGHTLWYSICICVLCPPAPTRLMYKNLMTTSTFLVLSYSFYVF